MEPGTATATLTAYERMGTTETRTGPADGRGQEEQKEPRDMIKSRKWNTVQEYLDDTNRRRVNQATRNLQVFRSPEWKQRQSVALKKVMRDPARRANLRQKSLALWQDPAYRARQLRVRAEQAAKQHYYQQRWGDQDKGAQHSAKMRARWSDPAYRQRMSAKMRHTQQDPALKRRQSEISRLRWQDPAYRQRLAVSMQKARQRKKQQNTG